MKKARNRKRTPAPMNEKKYTSCCPEGNLHDSGRAKAGSTAQAGQRSVAGRTTVYVLCMEPWDGVQKPFPRNAARRHGSCRRSPGRNPSLFKLCSWTSMQLHCCMHSVTAGMHPRAHSCFVSHVTHVFSKLVDVVDCMLPSPSDTAV
jgi:hypothetical protein